MNKSRPQVMEELALKAWNRYKNGDADALNDVYEEIFPFCMRVASRVCGHYLDTGSEESSTSRIALWEAFEKYEPARGNILPFIGQVIRTRIMDQKRKEKRKIVSISLSSERYQHPIDDTTCENIIEELARQQEIEQLQALLKVYNIDFQELVKQSPKQAKTRREANKIARLIAGDEELLRYLQARKNLPVKDLQQRFGSSEKLLERHRKYIIAHTLVLMHDFSVIGSYINEGRGI
ncbi:sigma factor [Syntrophomonas palmitatica]|uniref:sigma factor n=1 Tax=Syntrophomonas palmitatica TaxID=402877 RepID=UPI0006D1AB0C|nr:sigma factor [Syntrophomonas palmitatica]